MPPYELYTGVRLDVSKHLRADFGDYVQATVVDTDNSMNSRTEGCIATMAADTLTGSWHMLRLSTNTFVTRDRFEILPLPDLLLKHLNDLAAEDGLERGGLDDPTVIAEEADDPPPLVEDSDDEDDEDIEEAAADKLARSRHLPRMIPAGGGAGVGGGIGLLGGGGGSSSQLRFVPLPSAVENPPVPEVPRVPDVPAAPPSVDESGVGQASIQPPVQIGGAAASIQPPVQIGGAPCPKPQLPMERPASMRGRERFKATDPLQHLGQPSNDVVQ